MTSPHKLLDDLRELRTVLGRMAMTEAARRVDEAIAFIESQQWKPIAEAPLDETTVDLWIDRPALMGGMFPAKSYRVADCRFLNENWLRPGLNRFVDWDHATHWKPTPTTPPGEE